MVDDASEVLRERLDVLIKLCALGSVSGKPQREQIGLLSRAGLYPRDIAELLGTTRNTVSVTLAQLKKATRRTRVKNDGA